MIELKLSEIAAIVAGQLVGQDVLITADPVIDSRAATSGSLFAAIAGERVNGLDFVAAAKQQGAVGALAVQPTEIPTVVVADVPLALAKLAQYVVSSIPNLTVIGLTGSQGKTSTKDLLAAVLDRVHPTIATQGNFNNELGVPLTMLRVQTATRFLVLEMGARHLGDIAQLVELATPNITGVLNVGSAHLGEFGSVANIAAAKSEIYAGLNANGAAFVNFDDPAVKQMKLPAGVRKLSYGADPKSELKISELSLNELAQPTFSLTYHAESARLQLPLVGEHQAINAAAAGAAALLAGLTFTQVIAGLAEAKNRSAWRMELHETASGMLILNDSYNANPDSMRSALAAVKTIATGRNLPCLAVLGEMRELGPDAETLHREIGAYASELEITELLLVGDQVSEYGFGFGKAKTHHVADVPNALAWIRENVTQPVVVLVKASRAVGLDQLVAELLTTDEEVK